MRTIKCQICGKEVEAKGSRQKYCQDCKKEKEREQQKKYYENNKGKRRAYDKERYENNKEQIRAQHKEYYKEYYENNREKIIAKKKEYSKNNKEMVRALRKEYYENNKERICKQRKERYENNKEKEAAQNKKWRENNKEKKAAQRREWYEKNHIYADREGNNFCVYIHTDPLGKVYVGRSFGEDVESVNRNRWNNGISYKGQKFYDECIAVYGWDNIQHELLEWGLTYEEVIEREQYWIERYNSRNPEYGYNIA